MTHVPDRPVASPCVGVCRLDRQQVCVGCGRRLDEIAAWPTASEPRRRLIVVAAAARLAARSPRSAAQR